MIEWQNEASLFVVRIQGKQWYWAYKYNSDTNYRLQNLFINVGNDNWFRTTTPSHRLFSSKNSTLSFIYEYEFKKLHKFILTQKGRDFSKINNLTNTTHATTTNNIAFDTTTNISLKNFFKKNTTPKINLYTSTWNISNTSNLFQLSNIEFNANSFLINLYKKNLQTSQIITNTLNKIKSNTKFDSDILDDLDESSENLRIKLSNFPVKLIKGTLNNHNSNLLNTSTTLTKNIFLTYRINNSTVAEKISQVEQFWGFRQKKYKKLRAFSFPQNYKFHNKTYTPIKNFIQNDNINK